MIRMLLHAKNPFSFRLPPSTSPITVTCAYTKVGLIARDTRARNACMSVSELFLGDYAQRFVDGNAEYLCVFTVSCGPSRRRRAGRHCAITIPSSVVPGEGSGGRIGKTKKGVRPPRWKQSPSDGGEQSERGQSSTKTAGQPGYERSTACTTGGRDRRGRRSQGVDDAISGASCRPKQDAVIFSINRTQGLELETTGVGMSRRLPVDRPVARR